MGPLGRGLSLCGIRRLGEPSEILAPFPRTVNPKGASKPSYKKIGSNSASGHTAFVPALNPLFEREWRERFRRPPSYLQLGGLVVGLAILVCYGVWRARFEADLSATQWRQNGRALLDFYRWAGAILGWGGALLLGATSVSEEKTGATWEHLLLCPFGGRGLACGKIASGAAFLLALQGALLPVLLVAGFCFGASPAEVGTVMVSHLLLTVQGATLGFWGALRGQTLLEGIAQSLGAIGRVLALSVCAATVGLLVLTLFNFLLHVLLFLPIPGTGRVLGAVWPFLLTALWALSRGVLSLVAGVTGIGVPLLSCSSVNPYLLPVGIFVGQLLGIALFLKWSAWEIDYPTRDFWPPTPHWAPPSGFSSDAAPPLTKPTPVRALPIRPASHPANFRARPATVRPDAPRPDPSRPMPASSAIHRVPPPFEELPSAKGQPALFGASPRPNDKPRPLFEAPPIPILPAEPQTPPAPPPKIVPLGPEIVSLGQKNVPPAQTNQLGPYSEGNGHTRIMYGVWSWELSPSQLRWFPPRERREARAKSSALLPTWGQTYDAPLPAEAENDDAHRNTKRMRAPVSRRWQELNPVLWLDLTRCLSLRSPDSSMVTVLLALGALGGSFVGAVALFLLVGWIQNSLGGARGDVSSLLSTWNGLHWMMWWGALACGPIWGATGYVVERRTGMLVELRLTLISARAMWWGKFGARFLIPATLSLPLLALVAFFAWNWPDKNAPFEVVAALISTWALAAWSLLACLWVSDSTRRELAASLWCGAFALAWGALLWNFPTLAWTPIHLGGAILAGGSLLLRLKRLGFG